MDTEFTLITDDDHGFSRATRLGPVLAYLRRNPEVDVVGMGLMNLPEHRVADVGTRRMTEGSLEPLREHGEVIDGRLAAVVDLSVGAYHLRTPYRRDYMDRRGDLAADRAYLRRTWAAVAAGRAPSDVTRFRG